NIGILVAGALFVLSAWWALAHGTPRVAADPTWRGVALPYAGGLVFTALLTWLTVTGRMPDFYVEGKGYTVLREPVLGFGVAEVLAAAVLFGLLYRRVRSRFLLWCSAGLAMMGVALGGALITGATPGTPLAWVTRAGQWLGGAYLLVATLGIEGRGAWILPLERSLREAEDRYRNLVDMSPDAVLVHAGGRYVFANPAAARVLGADSAEDIIGMEGIAVVHPDFREVVQRRVDQVYSGAIAPPEEYRLLRLDGTPFDAEVTRTRVRFDGRPAVQTVVRDISERKRAAETLRESEERYRIVAQFTYDWEHWRDPAGHFLYSSPSAERVTGYTADEFIRDPDLFLRIVHPHDRERMRQHAVGDPSCTGIEYRLVRRDGEERWIDHACQMITDSEGRPLGRRGSDRDITERKLAEEQLESARRRAAAGAYARRLIEVSLDPLVTISPDGKITDVNEATIKVTGRARDELIGTDFSDYFTDPESARAGYREAFARGSVTDYPLTIRDQDGKLTDVLYNASVYRDQEGQVLGVFAAARDITALRMLEEQRALVNRLQNALLDVPAQARGVQFGHLYRSATKEAQVGGDFYDVFELKDGCIAVLIGDVSGHGVEAARIATLVKDVIHAFAHQHSRPGAVLRETNALLIEKHIPGFVTLFLGTLDPKDGSLTYCSAGHPNALLRGRSGEIELLEANSPPLGVFVDQSWRESEVRLEVDDLLFLYTDGVIEARRDGELFGQEGLMAILKGWTGSSLELLPQAVLSEVLAFSEGSLSDDLAILALRLTADAGRDSSDAMLGIRGT
ncbi:MAG: PAS domain S-box protein, partial [Candidatus Eisenbacteria bacterium]|nr:PAS domain S-box protein [Candidatus Eisenbacteria bacterium]